MPINIDKNSLPPMSLISDTWVLEEAKAEAEYFIEYMHEKTPDENHQAIIKLRNHWIAVFGTDAQGVEDMKRFSDEFNRLVYTTGIFDKAM